MVFATTFKVMVTLLWLFFS